MADTCPTCGQAVQIITGDEGTSHFEGQERQRVREELAPVVKRLERIRDLDEQTSDGALGSLARYALDDIAALDSLEEGT